MDENTVFDTEKVIKNHIVSINRGHFRLEIAGWAYKEGQNLKTFNSKFVLKNKEDEKMYLLKTGMQEMQEFQFVDGYECLNCGLKTQSMVFGLPNGIYDLYILYQNDGENLLVDTEFELEI